MPADPILITGGLGFLGSHLWGDIRDAEAVDRAVQGSQVVIHLVSNFRKGRPLGPMLALADLCEKCFVPFGIEPPLHRRRVSFFQNNRAFSIAKARRVLGFEPRMNLQDSLRATIGWYRAQGCL